MARIYLSAGETYDSISGAGEKTLIGTNEAETVIIAPNGHVSLDGSFVRGNDTLDLEGNAADYSIVQTGTSLVITSASGAEIVIPQFVSTGGVSLTFDDAALDLTSDGTNFMVGDQTVTDTATGIGGGTEGPSNPGDTFTLTTGVDDLDGTAANDTFQGILGSGSDATLGTFDAIDGQGGEDTLNLLVRGNDGVADHISVANVEVINLLAQNGHTVNNFNAAAFGADVEQIWQVDAAASISGLADGQIAGFRDVDGLDVGLGYANAATEAAIAIDNSTVNAVASAIEPDTNIAITGAGIHTVSISGSLETTAVADDTAGPVPGAHYDALGILNLDISGAGGTTGVQTLNLALDTDTQLNIGTGFGNIETIDASASTGGIVGALMGSDSEIALSSIIGGSGDDALVLLGDRFANDATIQTGTGNDSVILFLGETEDGSQSDFAIDGGAGNDALFVLGFGESESHITLSGGAGNDTLGYTGILESGGDVTMTGGAGGDAFAVSAANVSVNDAGTGFDGDIGMLTIADFGTGTDVLGLAGFTNFDGSFAAQNAVDNAVDNLADDATLFDAVQAVTAVTATGQYAQFDFGDSTYLLSDSGQPYAEGSMLVDLNGAHLSAQNVVAIESISAPFLV